MASRLPRVADASSEVPMASAQNRPRANSRANLRAPPVGQQLAGSTFLPDWNSIRPAFSRSQPQLGRLIFRPFCLARASPLFSLGRA